MKTLKAFTKRAASTPEKVPGTKNLVVALHKAKEVSPDQVIPMDDEDFKDF